MSLQEKMKRLKLTPLPTPQRAVPVLMSLNDETLPDDIKQLIKENNVESIVFRDKQDSMNANYTSLTNKETKTLDMVLMNFLFLNDYVKILGKQFIF